MSANRDPPIANQRPNFVEDDHISHRGLESMFDDAATLGVSKASLTSSKASVSVIDSLILLLDASMKAVHLQVLVECRWSLERFFFRKMS